jgi:hypothetical protein
LKIIFNHYLKTIAIAFVLLVVGCGRIQTDPPADAAELLVDFSVEPTDPAVGPTQLRITLTDGNGQPVDDATLNIEGNMTHAGMTPVFAQASGGEDGQYLIPFEWTMGGDWIVTVEVTLADGRAVTRQFTVVVE